MSNTFFHVYENLWRLLDGFAISLIKMINFIFECEMWNVGYGMNQWIYVLPIHMCHELDHYGFIGKLIYSIKLYWDHLHWNCNLNKMV